MNKRQRKKMEKKIAKRYDYICDIASVMIIARNRGNTYLRNRLLRIIKDKQYKSFKDFKKYFGGNINENARVYRSI